MRNGEVGNGYTNLLNADFLNEFSLIIYGERENTPLPVGVSASLEAYIQAGGHLLVTGADAIGYSPVDLGLADLVRGLNPADLFQFNPTWEVANINHPIINGPFGDFRGQVLTPRDTLTTAWIQIRHGAQSNWSPSGAHASPAESSSPMFPGSPDQLAIGTAA